MSPRTRHTHHFAERCQPPRPRRPPDRPPPPEPPPPPPGCPGCPALPDPVYVEITGSFIPDCNGFYTCIHDGTPTCYWDCINADHPRSNATLSWNGIWWNIAHGGDCYCGVTEILSDDCHVGGSIGGCWGGLVTLTP